MEFSEEAKREIERNLAETARNISVNDVERADILKELRSTYYEAATGEAQVRGSETVTLDDVKAARAGLGSPREMADSFMKAWAANLKRAGFWWRAAAFAIDCAIIGALSFIIMSPIIAFILFTGMPVDDVAHEAWFYALSPALKIAFIATVATVLPAFLVVFLGYNFGFEGHFGRTPGKALMGLKVLRSDGTKIGYKEAILRNLSKYNQYLIVIDVLIMLIFFNKEKQRGCDRMANTIVVHKKA